MDYWSNLGVLVVIHLLSSINVVLMKTQPSYTNYQFTPPPPPHPYNTFRQNIIWVSAFPESRDRESRRCVLHIPVDETSVNSSDSSISESVREEAEEEEDNFISSVTWSSSGASVISCRAVVSSVAGLVSVWVFLTSGSLVSGSSFLGRGWFSEG